MGMNNFPFSYDIHKFVCLDWQLTPTGPQYNLHGRKRRCISNEDPKQRHGVSGE